MFVYQVWCYTSKQDFIDCRDINKHYIEEATHISSEVKRRQVKELDNGAKHYVNGKWLMRTSAVDLKQLRADIEDMEKYCDDIWGLWCVVMQEQSDDPFNPKVIYHSELMDGHLLINEIDTLRKKKDSYKHKLKYHKNREQVEDFNKLFGGAQ